MGLDTMPPLAALLPMFHEVERVGSSGEKSSEEVNEPGVERLCVGIGGLESVDREPLCARRDSVYFTMREPRGASCSVAEKRSKTRSSAAFLEAGNSVGSGPRMTLAWFIAGNAC